MWWIASNTHGAMTAVLSSASSNSASGSGNNNASASANADADASASPANPSSNPVHRAPGNSNPQQQQQPLLSATPTVGEDGHEMVDISLAVSAGHTPQAPPTPTPEEVGFDPRVKNPRAWLNGRQFSYLLLSQAIPSMVIAGGLNAACAYPTYSSPRPPPGPPPDGSIPPFLFRPPLSLIVDATFTTFIQSVITWLILAYLVNRSISRGEVAPHQPPRFKEPTNAFWRWFLMLDHYNSSRGSVCFSRRGWLGRQSRRLCQAGNLCVAAASPASSPNSSPAPERTQSPRMKWLSTGLTKLGSVVTFTLANVGRALLVAFPATALMLGPTIGFSIIGAERYDGDWVFLGRWAGMIFKAVYGGVLGFWLSPLMAWMWMLRAGWIVGKHILVV